MHSETRRFLDTVSRPAGPMDETLEVISIADNCRFDERLTPARWSRFEAEAARNESGELAVWADWVEMETRYRQNEVEVSRLSVPATFLPGNESAWLQGLAEQQLAASSLKCDTAQPVRCRPNGNSLLAHDAG